MRWRVGGEAGRVEEGREVARRMVVNRKGEGGVLKDGEVEGGETE